MPYIAYLPNSRVTLLDLDEVAEVLNVSRKTAYRYCKSGKLPSNSVSGQVMVSEDTLLAFLHMENTDDTTGQHWPMEQTTAVMRAHGLHYDPAVWYAAMNMIYSDYFKTAKKHGVNTVEFFADMTDAFLDDKDAGTPEEKISAYYHCVAS